MSALLLVAGLGLAATPPGSTPQEPSALAKEEPTAMSGLSNGSTVIESIEETTVGELSGLRVGMASVTTGEYALADGSRKTGRMCALAINGAVGVFVGVGSVVTVNGARWEIIGLEKTPGELGEVRLRLLGP